MNNFINKIEKIHTTKMGLERMSLNLNLPTCEVVEWCKTAIANADLIIGQNKNFYAYYKGFAITINAKSHTIITAKKIHGKVFELQKSDYVCLKEFLFQAIFIPKGEILPTRDIVNSPELVLYIKDFGTQKCDLGVGVEQNGQIVGAAWTRIIPAYGRIDNNTPELVISMFPEFRGCGIGTRLMKKLFKLLQANGYTQTSLSVQKDNPAVSFYSKLGYKIVDKKTEESEHECLIMVKSL